MHYVDKFVDWFGELGWKGKVVVAGVLGLLSGLASLVTGGMLMALVGVLLLLDFVTDDILELHGSKERDEPQ